MARLEINSLLCLIFAGCSAVSSVKTDKALPVSQRPATTVEFTLEFSKNSSSARQQAFQSLVAEHPAHADLRYNFGVFYDSLGLTDSALSCYRAAIGLDSTLADAHYNFAYDFFLKGNFDSAYHYFSTAKRWQPDAEDIHLNLILSGFSLAKICADNLEFARAESLILQHADTSLEIKQREAEARWHLGQREIQALAGLNSTNDSLELLKASSRQLNACAELKTGRAADALLLLSDVYGQMALLCRDSTPLTQFLIRQGLYRRSVEAVLLSAKIKALMGETPGLYPDRMAGRLMENSWDLVRCMFPPGPSVEDSGYFLLKHLARLQSIQAAHLFLTDLKSWSIEQRVSEAKNFPVDSLMKYFFDESVRFESELVSETMAREAGSEEWLDLSDLHREWSALRRPWRLPLPNDWEGRISSLISQEAATITVLISDLDSTEAALERISQTLP